MNHQQVAVVIPFYNPVLSKDEKLSLACWRRHLSSFDTYSLSPDSLQTTLPGTKPIHFPDHNFISVRSYSEMLLTPSFYEAFANYEYILIYQLDALVFSNQLTNWCNQGLSYIGAPWNNSRIGQLTSSTTDLRGGNGGLSLRRIPDFLEVLQKTNDQAEYNLSSRYSQWLWFGVNVLTGKSKNRWLQTKTNQYPFNEDGFWSFEAPKYFPQFIAATRDQSLKFAFETLPAQCFSENGNKLPFGCHAWAKYDRGFWTSHLDNTPS